MMSPQRRIQSKRAIRRIDEALQQQRPYGPSEKVINLLRNDHQLTMDAFIIPNFLQHNRFFPILAHENIDRNAPVMLNDLI